MLGYETLNGVRYVKYLKVYIIYRLPTKCHLETQAVLVEIFHFGASNCAHVDLIVWVCIALKHSQLLLRGQHIIFFHDQTLHILCTIHHKRGPRPMPLH